MKKSFTFFSLLGLLFMVFVPYTKSHAQCAEIFPSVTRVFDTLTSHGNVQAVHIQYRPTSKGRSSIRVEYKLAHENTYADLACIDLGGLGTTIIKDTTIVTNIQSENEINVRITTHTNGTCGGSTCSGDIALEFSTNTPLAISLAKFEAINVDRAILLKWVTLSESETLGFEIQRSREGHNWEKVDFVKSKSQDGYSNQILEYEFMDSEIHPGAYLYRLKELTYNGQSQISSVVSVFFGSDKENRFEIYPNPTQSVINILSDLEEPSYQLIDAMGREVTSKIIKIDSNTYDLSSLKSGIYQFLVLDKTGQVLHSSRIIKL